MKKAPRKSTRAVLRKEYDFSTGVRGKYAARFAEGTNLVRLDADLVARFPDSDAVNRALESVPVPVSARSRNGPSGAPRI